MTMMMMVMMMMMMRDAVWGQTCVSPVNHVFDVCTLAPNREYDCDGSICEAASMPAVATLAAATGSLVADVDSWSSNDASQTMSDLCSLCRIDCNPPTRTLLCV